MTKKFEDVEWPAYSPERNIDRLPEADPFYSLIAAQEKLAEAIGEGGMRCELCGKWAKADGRPFNKNMAAAFLWMVKQYTSNGGRWINVPNESPEFVKRTKEYSTVKHWGLIEKKPKADGSGGYARGYWRPTDMGVAFAKRQLSVPEKVVIYDDELLGFKGSFITIDEALGTDFVYEDIWKPVSE